MDLLDKQTFESLENTAVSAAILCLVFCVCDVMNKVSMCGKSVCKITGQPFFCCSLVKNEPT